MPLHGVSNKKNHHDIFLFAFTSQHTCAVVQFILCNISPHHDTQAAIILIHLCKLHNYTIATKYPFVVLHTTKCGQYLVASHALFCLVMALLCPANFEIDQIM